jgi:hypothetical protein
MERQPQIPFRTALRLARCYPVDRGTERIFLRPSLRSVATGAFECIFVCRQELFGVDPLVCENAFDARVEAVQEASVLGSVGGCK